LLSKTVDLLSAIGTPVAFVGFTSGTGGANANHDILAWEFTNDFDPINDPILESVNNAPFIETFGPSTFTEGASPVIVDPDLTLTDVEDDDISGAKVSIGDGFVPSEDSGGRFLTWWS